MRMNLELGRKNRESSNGSGSGRDEDDIGKTLVPVGVSNRD